MTTPTPRGEGEVRLLQRYADAHDRLMNGPAPPPPKPRRARPVSPFNPARRLVDEVRQQPARWQRIFTAAIIELDEFGRPVLDQVPQPHWRKIAAEVSHKHGIGVLDMLSSRRSIPVVAARNEAFWRCRMETTMTLPQIGGRFNRDHTTVLHGIRMHEKRIAEASDGTR